MLEEAQEISGRVFQQPITKVPFGEQDSQLRPLETLGRRTSHGGCVYYAAVTHLVLLVVHVM